MQHFNSIHYLRALAAMMVVVLHSHTGAEFMQDRVDQG
jgi:surface polysaccharide O-acyltransferase-like enzyme